jgi:ketosteroid isomerase-like protein
LLATVSLAALIWVGVASTRSREGPQSEVRERERAFAQTMADRDHAAFATFLADEAIFLGSEGVFRVKAGVTEGWQPLFQGARAPFSWRPQRVEATDSGMLAVSTGPVFDPEGRRIGTFTSTWRRERDDQWRIVLDSGCSPCRDP